MDELRQFLNSFSNPVMAICAIFIAKSVSELNTKMAVVVNELGSHDTRIKRLEDHTN